MLTIDQIRRVLIAGAGRMGTEIALQCAIGGYEVILQDLSEDQLAKAMQRARLHLDEFVREGRLTTTESEAVLARISTSADFSRAANVDLVNESIPENLKAKRELFTALHGICPPHTLFTSNTSYLRPSQLAGHVGRPAQFACLHFHPPVWKSNLVDVMPHEGTDPQVVELLRRFSGRIGQIPIVYKQQGEGYVFNTMLRTWLLTAITLADSGIATVEDIDRSWMGVMLSHVGPFGILDNIGLDTVSDILGFWGMILRDPQARKASAYLKPYVDAGRLGIKTMHGFYEYPDAAYLRDDFLTAAMSESTEPDALIRRFTNRGRSPIRAGTPEGSPAATPATPPEGRTEERPERYILKAQPTPLHQKIQHSLRFAGACLIAGDNPDARALQRHLQAAGGAVTLLSLDGNPDDVLKQLDELWTRSAFPHLFLMSGRDPDAANGEVNSWAKRRFDRGVQLPFDICQRWYAEVLQRGLFETASVVGCTALGGDFGLSQGIEAVEGGGIAGLLKAVYLEGAVRSSLGPLVKVVDAPMSQPPEMTAEQVAKELALAQASVVTGSRDESRRRYTDVEVGYARGVRRQLFLQRSPVNAPEMSDEWAVPPGSNWVVTGGARGITAFVARELGRRFGLRLHLLGTTLLDDGGASASAANASSGSHARKVAEIRAELEQFKSAGVHASYHVCDVTDRAQLAATLETIRNADGPISGVLHGAGLEIGAKLPEKKRAEVKATLAVKALGMAHLVELTERDPLQWFIAFGSLSGRFGNYAQTDYSMANELLAKQLVAFRAARPECRAVVFHWPGWEEVGMAARPEGKEGLRRGHHTFLNPADGIALLTNEMRLESPAAEVVVIHRNEIPLEMRLPDPQPGKRAPTWQG